MAIIPVDTDPVPFSPTKLLNLSIRDDTSFLNEFVPMTAKKYSVRDFDADTLIEMTDNEANENVDPPLEPVEPAEPDPIIIE